MGILTLPFLFAYNTSIKYTSLAIFIVPVQSLFYQSFFIWNFGGSWSVSVELFLYPVFPFILHKIHENNRIIFLAGAYIASSLIIPIALVCSQHHSLTVYYSSPLYRLPEFVFGMALAQYFIAGKKVPMIAFISAIIAMFFVLQMGNNSYMQRNYLTLPLIGVCIMYLAQIDLSYSRLAKPLIYLGKVSYSFYLMQIPVMLFLDKTKKITVPNTLTAWGLIFCINIIMAIICYHFIEDNKRIRSIIINGMPEKYKFWGSLTHITRSLISHSK